MAEKPVHAMSKILSADLHLQLQLKKNFKFLVRGRDGEYLFDRRKEITVLTALLLNRYIKGAPHLKPCL